MSTRTYSARADRKPDERPRQRMSGGRIAALIVAVMVMLASVLGLVVGGTLGWLDQSRRDGAGFVSSDTVAMSTSGYALTSEKLMLHAGTASLPQRWFGEARVRIESASGGPVFIGLASTADVDRYLTGVEYTTVKEAGPSATTYDQHSGGAPAASPETLGIWRAQASGSGTQSLVWPVENGDWTLVVMAPDGARGVSVQSDVGITAPALQPLWIGILISSGVFLLLGAATVVLALTARRNPRPVVPSTSS